jgi:hypothetical protein
MHIKARETRDTEPDFRLFPDKWLDWWNRHYNPDNCPLRRADGEVLLKQRQWVFAACG